MYNICMTLYYVLGVLFLYSDRVIKQVMMLCASGFSYSSLFLYFNVLVYLQDSSSLLERKQAIIHRYEKRIRRTQKVAIQTEQSLKQQLSQLQTVKDELSRCIAKLEEKAHSGDSQALLKIKNAEVRIQQVAKILPYLSKYIQVNKQAELQCQF